MAKKQHGKAARNTRSRPAAKPKSATHRALQTQWTAQETASAIGAKAAEVSARWGEKVDVLEIVRDSWERAGATAHTYRELADALGMTCADPERTLKQYFARGMPGKPAAPGKKNGRFDVELCKLWIAAHVRSGGGAEGGDLRERILQLELEIKEREKLESLERLADVNEVGEFLATCVANARAMLEALPDEVLAQLEGVGEARRKTIHQRVTDLVDNAFEELQRLGHGDDDLTDEEEEPSSSDGALAPALA